MLNQVLAIWSPDSFGQWIGTTATFTVLAIAALLVSIYIFEKMYHIDFNREISQHETGTTGSGGNNAAAIVLAAFIIAVAYVIGKAIGQ